MQRKARTAVKLDINFVQRYTEWGVTLTRNLSKFRCKYSYWARNSILILKKKMPKIICYSLSLFFFFFFFFFFEDASCFKDVSCFCNKTLSVFVGPQSLACLHYNEK